MNELIEITKDKNGNDIVSGKRLHEILEIRTRFFDWIKRMIEYGFVENVDYSKLSTENQGFTYDYAITLGMAKEIAMIQRTEEGKKLRQYLIACEQKLKEIVLTPAFNLPQTKIEAVRQLLESLEKNEVLEIKIKEDEPKVALYDAIIDSDSTFDMAAVSKMLNIKGLGRNNLIKKLKELKVFRDNGEPYQEYVSNQCFKRVEAPKNKKGKMVVYNKTVAFQKGVDLILRLLTKNNQLCQEKE